MRGLWAGCVCISLILPALVDETAGFFLRNSLSLLFSSQIETPNPQPFLLADLLTIGVLATVTAV